MTADYEDLWAGCWGEMQNVGPVHRHMRRLIVEVARELRPDSILDVGCGNGANLAAIQQTLGPVPREIVGLDLAASAVERAKERVQGEFHVMDVEKEPPLARTFDFVLTNQVIEHLYDDDGFLVKLRAMCHGYCLVGTMQGTMRESEKAIGHLRNYTTPGLQGQMRRAGFSIERTIGWGFPFYSPMYRTAIEWVGGNEKTIAYDKKDRFVANALFHLYKLNSSRRGDVLMILGKAI